VKIYTDIEQLREAIRHTKRPLGIVPTMGYLHKGHLELIRHSKNENESLVVTIFVNPTQFGPDEDFRRYPKKIDQDINLLEKIGVDFVFIPDSESIYNKSHETWVTVEQLSTKLEGQFRPNHFKGVTTIVLKLLNITTPDNAYFGQKDAQQVKIIQQMVRDLNLPVVIKSIPTVREHDGLAFSSRNIYLSRDERKSANEIYKGLIIGKELFKNGTISSKEIKESVTKHILSGIKNSKIDYISIASDDTFEEINIIKDSALLSIAIHLGKTRLIDNIILEQK